ncbi:uncharacterized protein I206_105707 [Kwoniella pini CBS 10737]|uniref:Protein CPL1-like domain-containing protein n=1 Tax=Kwoniella pini CBS 10737 TaxID=1296096 RepID=A0A1B9I3G9_9TREE|nr:uncharacterized protein I206_03390 [Kwoniella pini CBS 10737]OCF50074.1 hypothetical protein I206_03390 [Kwoniella pini CBS 10737]
MLQTILLALGTLVALPTVWSQVTYSSQFATCATSSYVPSGGAQSGAWSSADDCAAYCYNRDTSYIYSAWTSTTSGCSCGTNSFDTDTMAQGNPGGCGSNYEVTITHTTWDFELCTNNYQFTTANIQSHTSDYYSIFSICAPYAGMAIWSTTNDQFYYACGSGYESTGATSTCDYGVNRIYSHPADATVSQLAKRSLAERRRIAEREKRENYWCHKGLTACQLEEDSNSFECVDTQNDLESCGGCLHGAYNPAGNNITVPIGIDCSSIPGVSLGHSTCSSGKCDFDCKKGWEVRGDKCVKAESLKRSVKARRFLRALPSF